MLDKKKKYLQIAFNRPLEEVVAMINSLPLSERIIIEIGYPLIKSYGMQAVRVVKTSLEQRIFGYPSELSAIPFQLKSMQSPLADLLLESIEKKNLQQKGRKVPQDKNNIFHPYIVADLKCMDRAFAEVEAAAHAGASAVTCLGLAPLETINEFIKRCEEIGVDSMLDMINIEYPFEVLTRLSKPPTIIMLHRGVDEREKNKEKEIPYHEIEKIKGVYDDILIAVAGGETIREVISGAFNDADILIAWRIFNENPEKITEIAGEFLEKIK